MSRIGAFGDAVNDDIIFIFLPVIVTDGTLYEAHLTNQKLVLNATDHVVVKTDYKPPAGRSALEFCIDVLPTARLGEWLQMTNKTLRLIRDIVNDRRLKTKRLQLRKKLLIGQSR
jgi:hypothetical protein